MMMSRPQAGKAATSKIAPVVESTAPTKSTHEAVKDLERRLALLGDVKDEEKQPESQLEPPAFASKPPPPAVAETATTAASRSEAPVKGGNNALLARILAAQERAKAAGQKQDHVVAPPPPIQDLLTAPPPAFETTTLPPPLLQQQIDAPPPFETFQQQQAPPPTFDIIEQTLVDQTQVHPVAPPVYEPTMFVPPPMSAPAFEDLLDLDMQVEDQIHQQSLEGMELMQAPAVNASAEDGLLMIEGLSEEERKELLDEQRRIMDQIEQERAANEAAIAAAAADAFDSRSAPSVARVASDPSPTQVAMPTDAALAGASSTLRKIHLGNGHEVALHGQERTRAAIANGTAILVQCIHCQNWMQVTETATLMFCPVCSVVSPVERQGVVLTREEAMQMSSDRRMAEQLQNEEYENAQEAAEEEKEETWWEAVSGLFSFRTEKEQTPQPQPQVLSPTHRGEIGVARPPGSPSRAGLLPVSTGEEETINFSRSHDEHEGLLGSSANSAHLPKARVAERQPLFSCVVDSVSSAATSLGSALTSQTLREDGEGNVHGVDASSLLAITRASRDSDYQPLNNDDVPSNSYNH